MDPSKVDLKLNEQSRFVSWTIDPSNLTLHANDIHKKVIEKDVIELDEESAKTQDNHQPGVVGKKGYGRMK